MSKKSKSESYWSVKTVAFEEKSVSLEKIMPILEKEWVVYCKKKERVCHLIRILAWLQEKSEETLEGKSNVSEEIWQIAPTWGIKRAI